MERVDAPDGRKELGNKGEDAAAEALARRGYLILDRNWQRLPLGELDIVARKGDLVVFVEVRSASQVYLESPAMTVLEDKQGRVIRMASLYLQENRLFRQHTRFDVMAVMVSEAGIAIDWVEDAFRPRPTARMAKYKW
jgi:putative endonuclease